MGVVFGGRKAKEMYFQGRKIREAWYGGKKVYTAGQPEKPVEVAPPGFYGEAQRWLRKTLIEYGTTYEDVTELPFDLDTSRVQNASFLFSGCKSLVTAPSLILTVPYDADGMFSECESLTHVPDMDVTNLKYMNNFFYGCKSLTDGSVRLIRRDGTLPAQHLDMIARSGLTREPFYRPDGTPID